MNDRIILIVMILVLLGLVAVILTALYEDDPYREMNKLIIDMRRTLKEMWEFIDFKKMEQDFEKDHPTRINH